MPAATALLDLAAPRTVVIGDRDRLFALRCRRIMPEDWLAYFAGITVTSEQVGRERVNVVDVTTPRLALAEAVLESVEGYTVAGGAEIESLPNWQRKIPLAHRLLLAETLADARVSLPTGELSLEPESEVVLLDASWSAIGGDGQWAMQKFLGLKHILKTPTEEQHRRYSREASRARVIGGSRAGKTVYPGANALLAKLYDELIVDVGGYRVGYDLLEGRDRIVREMDLLHKVMAAQELFQPASTAQLAGGDEDR